MEIFTLFIAIIALLLQIRSSYLTEAKYNKKLIMKLKGNFIIKVFTYTWKTEPEYYLYPLFYIAVLVVTYYLNIGYDFTKKGMSTLFFIWLIVPFIIHYKKLRKKNHS